MEALWILLSILKIIGIILLIILIVILALICIVFFVPFVYDIKGKKYEDISGEGWVKWLFGIICIEFDYANGESDFKVKLFGRRLEEIMKPRANKKRAKKKKISKNKRVVKPKVLVSAVEKKLDKQPPMEEPSILELEKQPVITVEPEIVAMGKVSDEKVIVKRVKLRKIEEEIKMDTSKFVKIGKNQTKEAIKDENIGKKEVTSKNDEKGKIDIDYFKKMPWEEKKQVLKACTKLIKRLFKGVFPESVYIYATVGVGDPALTGYILALAGIVKGTINSNINIKGKFDQEIFEGELRIVGRIKIFTFISAMVKFIFTKSIYKIWRTYMKGKGE
jgi:Protein of unknown function (DUF2953).